MRKAFIGRGGFKLSDSGGRKVIDKMYDLENNGDPEFSGTDRPEWYDGMVCVEAERENFIDVTYPDSPPAPVPEDPENRHGCIFTNQATTASVPGLDPEKTYTAFCWVYILSGFDFHRWEIRASAGGVPVSTQEADMNLLDQWQYLELTFTGAEIVQFRTGGNGTISELYTALIQVEEGAYRTNYISSGTTRLAPAVLIEDALPETGTVAGRVDMVRTVGEPQRIFESSPTGASSRSTISIIDSNNVHAYVYGASGGNINVPSFPFDVDDGDRLTMDFALSWDIAEIYLFLRSGEEQYLYSGSHQINNDEVRDITIGSRNSSAADHSSMRYLIPWYDDETVRTTEEEFEQLFETIS